MKVGAVRTDVLIPEKGMRVMQEKYPFNSLTSGQTVSLQVTVEDGFDTKALKKKVVEAARAFEARLGKLKDGRKVKDFAVWMGKDMVVVGEEFDADAGETVQKFGEMEVVFVACREDNTAAKMVEDAEKGPAPASVKKAAPVPVTAKKK